MIMKIAVAALAFCAFLFSCAYEKIDYEQLRRSGGNGYVRLKHGWTNYEISGDRNGDRTVVLIHGGTIPLCIWDKQMDALRDAGFRIIRYDQYGRGYSQRPKTEYNRRLFLDQLKELLDSIRITEPVFLVGPSFGGTISINFAAHYPQMVRALILISPALNVLDSDSPLAGYFKILRIPILGEFLYKTFIRKKMIDRGRPLVPGGVGSSCDSIFIKQFRCKGTERALFSSFRGDAYGNYRQLSRQVSENIKNILLIRGKEDKEITEKMINEIRSDLPNCTYIEIEKSGHNPGSDAAEIFTKIIIEFIKNH